jgi:hypothetical protein
MRVPESVARVLRPELAVVAFCYLLPDLVDKPLWVFGVGCGRYVAHTLLFVFLVALVFSLKKPVYGLLALFAGMFHLLMDVGWFLPLFYPFIDYDFPDAKFSETFRWYQVAGLFLELVFALLLVSLGVWFLSWYAARRKPKLDSCGRSGPKRERDDEGPGDDTLH